VCEKLIATSLNFDFEVREYLGFIHHSNVVFYLFIYLFLEEMHAIMSTLYFQVLQYLILDQKMHGNTYLRS
jgi:hypothetical protein